MGENWIEQEKQVLTFHKKEAPGILVAACMVELAMEKLGEHVELKGSLAGISETEWCLPDAIQVMTGCTTGNRLLKVEKQLGRYALTMYDQKTGHGIRVAVRVDKIDAAKYPELAQFFHRTRDPRLTTDAKLRKESGKRIREEFAKVGRAILAWEHVVVKAVGKPPIPPVAICASCGESFEQHVPDSKNCRCCSGDAYFTRKP
ncbi:MAG TPA: FmdE family protein [Candidatus Ozemobacteraceae bacterium]|nr:FmdE family protein [Candidatus Ozemobacteraceae bacterium]